jgi:hypothetical protein
MGKSNHGLFESHESDEEEDAEWQRLTDEQFLQAYDSCDEIYDR